MHSSSGDTDDRISIAMRATDWSIDVKYRGFIVNIISDLLVVQVIIINDNYKQTLSNVHLNDNYKQTLSNVHLNDNIIISLWNAGFLKLCWLCLLQ